jgi:hypothetical protein
MSGVRPPKHDLEPIVTSPPRLGVELRRDGVAEIGSSGDAVFIPRDDIVSVELRHGSVAERPLVQIGCALVFMTAGLLFVLFFFYWMARGGWGTYYALGGVGGVIFGIILLRGLVRRGYYLRVSTRTETRKIVFNGTPLPDRIRKLLDDAHRDHGYRVVSRVPGLPGTRDAEPYR